MLKSRNYKEYQESQKKEVILVCCSCNKILGRKKINPNDLSWYYCKECWEGTNKENKEIEELKQMLIEVNKENERLIYEIQRLERRLI